MRLTAEVVSAHCDPVRSLSARGLSASRLTPLQRGRECGQESTSARWFCHNMLGDLDMACFAAGRTGRRSTGARRYLWAPTSRLAVETSLANYHNCRKKCRRVFASISPSVSPSVGGSVFRAFRRLTLNFTATTTAIGLDSSDFRPRACRNSCHSS